MRVFSWLYLAVAYAFVYLPVVVLAVFSFQDGRLPVPPLQGLTLRWYEGVLGNADLMAALGNSFLVALVSSLIALILGFLAAHALARVPLRGLALQQGQLRPLQVRWLRR